MIDIIAEQSAGKSLRPLGSMQDVLLPEVILLLNG